MLNQVGHGRMSVDAMGRLAEAITMSASGFPAELADLAGMRGPNARLRTCAAAGRRPEPTTGQPPRSSDCNSLIEFDERECKTDFFFLFLPFPPLIFRQSPMLLD